MYRWRRYLVVMAAVCVATAGLAVPARADTASGGCWAIPSQMELEGYAHFTRDGSGWRNWYLFAAKLNGYGFGDNSNINFYFYQDGAQHWTGFSPDSLGPDQWYSRGANINMPPWSTQQVRWEGIFDTFLSDPRCSALSAVVSG